MCDVPSRWKWFYILVRGTYILTIWYACSMNGSPFLHHRHIITVCLQHTNSNTRRLPYQDLNERNRANCRRICLCYFILLSLFGSIFCALVRRLLAKFPVFYSLLSKLYVPKASSQMLLYSQMLRWLVGRLLHCSIQTEWNRMKWQGNSQ